MKIYLDVCCLNRPFDDQTQDRIRLETEAIYIILNKISLNKLKLVNSDIIFYEIEKIPDIIRKEKIKFILSLSKIYVNLDERIMDRAQYIQRFGIKSYDSLHIASAEAVGTSVFLTTDDKLLKKTKQNESIFKIKIENPLNWIIEVLKNESI